MWTRAQELSDMIYYATIVCRLQSLDWKAVLFAGGSWPLFYTGYWTIGLVWRSIGRQLYIYLPGPPSGVASNLIYSPLIRSDLHLLHPLSPSFQVSFPFPYHLPLHPISPSFQVPFLLLITSHSTPSPLPSKFPFLLLFTLLHSNFSPYLYLRSMPLHSPKFDVSH